MKILGISCFYHDSAVALVENGDILFAAQEERFSRLKHDAQFPHKSIDKMFQELNITAEDIDICVFYEKPLLKFDRIISTYLEIAPKGFETFNIAIPTWINEKLFFRNHLKKQMGSSLGKAQKSELYFSEHHLSHAASAFYPSPFDKATILTVDGVGEWATTTLGIGENNNIDLLREIHFPHSLGLLYSAFTQYCGFVVNSGEYKLMGLAPYGKPIYEKIIMDNLIDQAKDGSFTLNLEYFNFLGGLEMINDNFSDLFVSGPRNSSQEISTHYCDIASSIQSVLEKVLIKLVDSAINITGEKNLVIAGGVALNCVANRKILEETPVDSLWVQPAAGDAGGSLGAALAYYYDIEKGNRTISESDSMQGAYLGTSYSNLDIKTELENQGLVFQEYSEQDVHKKTAKYLSEGKIVGLFNGRMEFGPRALGNRSILADPRLKNMQSKLNRKIKFRESFRPFAPSVLEEHSQDFFGLETTSPYMLLTTDVLNINVSENAPGNLLEKLNALESPLPAITHVDGSARIQTVSKETNPKYHSLLTEFYNITQCPVVVNTSFNVRGEPIVESPKDAIRCFINTDIDILSIGNFIVDKSEQDSIPKLEYVIEPGLD